MLMHGVFSAVVSRSWCPLAVRGEAHDAVVASVGPNEWGSQVQLSARAALLSGLPHVFLCLPVAQIRSYVLHPYVFVNPTAPDTSPLQRYV